MIGRSIGTALTFVLMVAGCTSGPPIGATAPAFAAEDARGNTVSMGAYEDKVLILDFWAVW